MSLILYEEVFSGKSWAAPEKTLLILIYRYSLAGSPCQTLISTYPFLGSYWRICPLKREGTLWKRNTWVIVRKGKGRERQRAPWDSEPEVQGGRHWKSMQHIGYFFLGGAPVFRMLVYKWPKAKLVENALVAMNIINFLVFGNFIGEWMVCFKNLGFESLLLVKLITFTVAAFFPLLCQLPYGFIAKILALRNKQVLQLTENQVIDYLSLGYVGL